MNTLELLGIYDQDNLQKLFSANTNTGSGFLSYSYRAFAENHPIFTATLVFRQDHRNFELSAAHRVDVQLYRRHPQKPKNRKQSFYFNGEEPIYSLMEAYNLLEGRYVLKIHTGEDGAERRSWAKINFNRRFKTGNYAFEHYPASSFDLRGLLVERFDTQNRAPKFIDELSTLIEGGFVALAAVPETLGIYLFSVAANPEFKRLDIKQVGFEPSGNVSDN